MVKNVLREVCPPIAWRGLRAARKRLSWSKGETTEQGPDRNTTQPGTQDLEVYWDPKMAEILETWGEKTVWREIQLLMSDRKGRILDIACGTGKTMSLLERFPEIEVHGCDISDLLIGKAKERGIAGDRLMVADAASLPYPDGSFDYAYTIGSLEHFTEEGIERVLCECQRVVKGTSFHMVPVSRSGRDEGWVKTLQSFYNNSPAWWERRCRASYPVVRVLESVWTGDASEGIWLICSSEQ
ncbi:class I SAM-dependent methyltransferase [Acidobacteria bacterium ACD]|nr:MAG: class I SAM-dependent methyltransferase [Acidobacteriota bacterium]MCE7956323.1 class I SAM-dependent methyltransferase [Acidobacteria bacterium ACB2]MDL1948427.1 class I SAM-dependent methyltransferase [Acidobacteria bacterium ACD]